MRGKSAEWWTTFGTLVQTVAVVFGVAVAIVELTNHEREAEKQRTEATLKFELEEPEKVSEARTSLELLRDVQPCEADSAKSSPYCQWVASTAAGLDDRDRVRFRGAIYARLDLVVSCIRASICDQTLALKLFCHDLRLLPGSGGGDGDSGEHSTPSSQPIVLQTVDDMKKACIVGHYLSQAQ